MMWWWIVAFGARAAEPALAWRWEGAPARYHAEALATSLIGIRFISTVNLDARALQVLARADLECRGERLGRRFDVECAVSNAEVKGVAFRGEQEDLDRIFAEYAELLDGATIQLEVREDGHVRGVDVEGVDKRGDRWDVVHEHLRQVARRLVTPLDLDLPRKPRPVGERWRHRGGPLLFATPSQYGTAGGTRLDCSVTREVDGDAIIECDGRATVATSVEFSSSGNLALGLIGVQRARFDPDEGRVAYAEVSVTGRATASTMSVGPQDRWALAAWVARVRPDGSWAGLEPGAPPAPEEPDEEVERVPTTTPTTPDVARPPDEPGLPEGPPEGAKPPPVPPLPRR